MNNNIRRYTAISGIVVDIVYYVDDRVAFDVITFDNKIIAIAIRTKAYEIQQSTHASSLTLYQR